MSDGRHLPPHELYRNYHRALLARARKICKSDDVAEEVCQEAWLVIFRSLDRFEGRSSLGWWMTRIVVNRSLSRMRRESRFVRSDDSETLQREVERSNADPITPESFTLGHELCDVIDGAMQGLPARQRRVLEMLQLEGRSSEEVCAEMDISPVNQRVLLHRARRSVRSAITALAA